MRSGGSCAAVRTWPVAWPPAPQPTGGSVGPALMGGGGSRANALCGCGWYLVDLAPRADGFRSTASSATPLGGRDANRVVHLPLELLLASAAVAVGSDGAVWRATLRRQGPANQLERANPARTARSPKIRGAIDNRRQSISPLPAAPILNLIFRCRGRGPRTPHRRAARWGRTHRGAEAFSVARSHNRRAVHLVDKVVYGWRDGVLIVEILHRVQLT
jgi:hypothetical protein